MRKRNAIPWIIVAIAGGLLCSSCSAGGPDLAGCHFHSIADNSAGGDSSAGGSA